MAASRCKTAALAFSTLLLVGARKPRESTLHLKSGSRTSTQRPAPASVVAALPDDEAATPASGRTRCVAAHADQPLAHAGAESTPESTPVHLSEDDLRERARLVLGSGASVPSVSQQHAVMSAVTNKLVVHVHKAIAHVFALESLRSRLLDEAVSKNKAFAYLLADVIGAPFPTADGAEAIGKRLGAHAVSVMRDESSLSRAAATALCRV